jgi:2,4-dienoyl-CoA reductase-like NADH-dependent reductase (Old Yellow Enzyme family)
MEGWDGTSDGNPSELSFRRWQKFGASGAKLIWGGEAIAVSARARANPNQLVMAPHTRENIARLRAVLIAEHRKTMSSDDGLLLGLQLTHSGRYCCLHVHDRMESASISPPDPGSTLKLAERLPGPADAEIETIIENFHTAAGAAWELGSISSTSSIATAISATNSGRPHP